VSAQARHQPLQSLLATRADGYVTRQTPCR
jgi:hypothetical protein